MTMTQRYAGMLRRHAGEWDKQGMPVQGECARQAARHMERREIELEHALIVARETLEKECDDGDELLRMMDLDPEAHRTEGGRLNLLRVRAALAERKTPNVCLEPPLEAAGRKRSARMMGWTPPRISVSKYQPATRGAGVGT